MKKALVFNALIILAVLFNGCSIINGVRHVTAPPNSSEDSKPKNGKPLEKANTEKLIDKAKEIAKGSFPLKLDTKAKVSGKILLIARSEIPSVGIKGFNYNGDDYNQTDLDTFGFKKENLAVKPEEIETVILKTCDKGKQIGSYSTSDGKKIPAFALDCKVSVIDYKKSVVIAEKKFPGKELAEQDFRSTTTKEIIAPEPWAAINAYIKNFPRQ